MSAPFRIVAFVGADPGLIRESTGANSRVLVSDAQGNAILDSGDAGVIEFWRDVVGHSIVAFGSGARLHSQTAIGNAVAAARSDRPEATGPSDFVALDLSPDGVLTAVSAGGANRLFVAPLEGGGAVLSNHLATVAAIGAPRVDRDYEDFFLGFGFLPDNRTVFEGIRQLPPAAVWTLRSGTKPMTSVHQAPPQADSGTSVIDMLLAATARHAGDADRHAVLLGGFDSALVCALLRELGKDVTGYTFDFGDARFRQTNIERVTNELGIDHEWVKIDPDRMRSALLDLPNRVNSPGAQPHYQLHTILASEDIAGDGFDLAYNGDGCDSLFLGYPTVNRRSHLVRRARRLPSFVNKAGMSLLATNAAERRLGHVARTGRSVLGAAALPWPASGHLPTRYMDETSLGLLRNDQDPEQAESVEEVRRRLASPLGDEDPTRVAYEGNALTGASRIKVDGAVMSTGVAQYTPFGDNDLKARVKALPVSELRPEHERPGNLGKALLIQEVLDAGILSEDVVLQPKQSPATSPIDSWYATELRSTVLELMDGLPFEWDRSYVDGLLAPKRAEDWYRERVALSYHAYQAVGLLASYGAFSALGR